MIKRSKAHPNYKTNDNRARVRRGDQTLWLSPRAVTTWMAMPSGKSAGQQHDSEFGKFHLAVDVGRLRGTQSD